MRCDRMQKNAKNAKKCKNHILHFFAFLSSFPFPRSQRDHDSPTTHTKPIQNKNKYESMIKIACWSMGGLAKLDPPSCTNCNCF